MCDGLNFAVVPVEAGGGDGDFLIGVGVQYCDALTQHPRHAEGLEDIDRCGVAIALQVDQGDARLSVVTPGNDVTGPIDIQQAVICQVGILAAIVSDGQHISIPAPFRGKALLLEPEVAMAILYFQCQRVVTGLDVQLVVFHDVWFLIVCWWHLHHLGWSLCVMAPYHCLHRYWEHLW